MGVSDGEIRFILFYVVFLIFMVTISALMPIQMFDNIPENAINDLNSQITLPTGSINPLDWFSFFGGYFAKISILFTFSSSFQFLSLILLILSTVAFFIIVKTLIDIIP